MVVGFLYYKEQNSIHKDIKFGSSLPLGGINKQLGLSVKEGAMAYFSYANDKKLLGDKKIEFISYDDKYEPELTLENLNKLLKKDRVFALFGFVGTPTIKAIMPIISDSDIPFIAPFSGASFLREPKRDNFVNFRSSYADEIEKIVGYLYYKKHLNKIAIFYQNDDYGDDGYVATIKSLRKRGLSLVSEGTYRRNTLSVTQALYDIYSSKPQAIVMVGAYKPVALFVKRYRKMDKKGGTIFCNISFVNADELVHELNYKTSNMIFSQTVPSYNDLTLPIVKEYRKILKLKYPYIKYGFVSLESYLDAKISVEALKNIKNGISREKFLKNLRILSKKYKDKKLFGRVFLFEYKDKKFIELK
jgi:ABC-type branched-subunit amino acid transport system substrate-binding protein